MGAFVGWKRFLSRLVKKRSGWPQGASFTASSPGVRRFFASNSSPSFGLLFDIDGVLVRGRNPIPGAAEAFRKLLDSNGKLAVPVVFVTNAGNCLRQERAAELSRVLGIEVLANQVILSHSPLQMFHHFQNKCVLVSGQGPVEEVAKDLGFTNAVSIEAVRQVYPLLDMVDESRRPKSSVTVRAKLPAIEAIVLLGEPVRWETSLQLILDILLSAGRPTEWRTPTPYPHIPILACNMDLLWMAEAQMPRFGHGTFLLCLETLYRKITGRELQYQALIGKPSPVTYQFAEHLILSQAKERGWSNPVRTLYAIGDNPMADIYGANLYNRSLQRHSVDSSSWPQSCKSILVCTGVYSNQDKVPSDPQESLTQTVFHGHRDFKFDPSLVEASYVVQDVAEALELIMKKEGWRSSHENTQP
ncbi:haloacid dehalogenase-like hydrolase domain-containing 5 [Bufo gargarizans]|uniref:haloacid dehalogenase-like hydrolase domain-containing 5 n=1 Tax=Bufo gargarizans TaxID=30331 RepID=UPI001CF14960|nr:haloacid dehalogenase-like hydrolase domain-containing 5 [Bufo gargarizans]XP_044137297.1 haloacid dehalogenase-like hydrolase domain-containing 5 [Bufo gargarizans]